MEIKKYTNENVGFGNMYIIISNDEFLVIDPCVKADVVMPDIKSKKCVGIFLTHAHFDHFCAIESWLGFGKIFLHQNAYLKLQDATENASALFDLRTSIDLTENQVVFVEENMTVKVGNEKGKVMEFFGHTDCSIALLFDNDFFCGDFIFEGGNIGRYDLPTGSAFLMRNSLRKLKSLDENITVHAGHGKDFLLKDFNKILFY